MEIYLFIFADMRRVLNTPKNDYLVSDWTLTKKKSSSLSLSDGVND